MHRVATKRELATTLAFSAVYLIIGLIVILNMKNHEFLLYVLVMIMILTSVVAIYFRSGLSRMLLWGFSVWGLLHLVGGLVPIPPHWHSPDGPSVVYNWRIIPGRLKYDQLVHGFGIGLVTWLCWQVLASRVRGPGDTPLKPTFGMLAVCTAAGMGFGSLNEIVEFAAVMILPETNVGGYHNTGWDLVANLVGAIIAVIVIRLFWIHDQARSKTADSGKLL